MVHFLKKRIIPFLLCVLLIACTLNPCCFAQEDQETRYVYISTEADLRALSQSCRLDTWSENAIVLLQDDIVLTKAFTPIPVFSGTFDGQGHTISNLKVNGSLSRAGLFGLVTSSGQIKNLVVSGSVTPSGEVICAGGIVAENSGYIEGCVFTGKVSSKTISGGIAGINNGVINGCANFSEVDVGIKKNSRITLKNIKSAGLKGLGELIFGGTIDSADDRSGGIAGNNSGSILSCKNLGLVGSTGKSQNSGGIAGCSSGNIALCSNYASVQGSKNVGGIVGLSLPYIKTSYSEDLLTGAKNEIDTILLLIDSLSYDVDDASAGISASMADFMNSVSAASANATNLSYQLSSVANSKISEVNELKDYANTAVSGLNGVSSGLDEIGTYFSDGLDDFSDGITLIKEWSGDESDDKLQQGLNCFVDGLGNIQGAINGLDDTTTEIHNLFTSLDNEGLPTFSTLPPEVSNSFAALSASISDISQKAKLLTYSLNTAVNLLTSNVRDITSEAQIITDNIYSAAYSLTDLSLSTFLYDASGDEFPSGEGSFGIVQNSVSTGSVEGSENVGGIVGCMSVSSSPQIDDNEDLGGVRIKSLLYRSIVSKCKSYGNVISNSSYAGGIVGLENIGAVTDCENYSPVKSLEGSYVGGIAGCAHGLVRNCFVRCSLDAKSYVGGIIGSGTAKKIVLNESSVIGNFAEVTISGANQHRGGIAGCDSGYFLYNYFVGSALNGIDEYSSESKAAPITRESLLSVDNLPEEFLWSAEQLKSVSSSSGAVNSHVTKSPSWVVALLFLAIAGLVFLIVFTIRKFIKAKKSVEESVASEKESGKSAGNSKAAASGHFSVSKQEDADTKRQKKTASKDGSQIPPRKNVSEQRIPSWKDPPSEDENIPIRKASSTRKPSWKD